MIPSPEAGKSVEKLDPKKEGVELLFEPNHLEHITDFFSKIHGQHEAIGELASTINSIELGIRVNTNGPRAAFFEIGPSGVGKTEAVYRMVRYFLNKQQEEIDRSPADCVIKIDCANFSAGHEVAKLTGSPPGYLGSAKTELSEKIEPIFSQNNIDKHTITLPNGEKFFFVLFDEFEKAHPSLVTSLLGVLDRGVFQLGDNSSVSFKDAVIIFTSNLGNKEVEKEQRKQYGFGGSSDSGKRRDLSIRQRALKDFFLPEFLGRLDDTIFFGELKREDFQAILKDSLYGIHEDFYRRGCEISLEMDSSATEWFLENGVSQSTGARNLHSLLQKNVVDKLAKCAVDPITKTPTFRYLQGRSFVISAKDGKIVFLEKERLEKVSFDLVQEEIDRLPGSVLWPGLKFYCNMNVSNELNWSGVRISSDENKKTLWLDGISIPGEEKEIKILIAGRDWGLDSSDVAYVKIENLTSSRNRKLYRVIIIKKDGTKFANLISNGVYIRGSDLSNLASK